MRAGVAFSACAHGSQAAVAVEGGAQRQRAFVCVHAGEDIFAPILYPLQRAACFARQPGQDHFLGEELRLESEGAADIRPDHANGVLRHAEDLGKAVSHIVGHLRGGPQREALLARVVARQHAPALKRHRRLARIPESPLDHQVGGGERLRSGPFVQYEPKEHIVGEIGMNRRLVARGRFQAGDRG